MYDDYYLHQVGHGMPFFSGTRVQRGHGLGNILSGLVRAAMPLVKSGVKALGRQGLKTGMQIAGDVFRGQKPKRAVRQRTKQAGKQLLGRALQQFVAPPGKPAANKGTKRRARGRNTSSSRATKRSRSSRDIFDK